MEEKKQLKLFYISQILDKWRNELSGNEFKMAYILLRARDPETGQCNLRLKTIAKRYGTTLENACNLIGRLCGKSLDGKAMVIKNPDICSKYRYIFVDDMEVFSKITGIPRKTLVLMYKAPKRGRKLEKNDQTKEQISGK